MYIIIVDNKSTNRIIVINIHILMSINTIGTHIKVSNFRKSERFYKSLGFKKVFEYGPTKKIKEDYSGAIFEHSGCKLEIADGHRAVKHDVFKQRITTSKISLTISVNKISAILRLCRRYHIPIAVYPRHYYWGTLEMVVKDPDGLVLVFITPYSEAEARKIKVDESWSIKP